MPWPTADIGWALVKISASGPMPTSRYCDQAPCSISTRLSSAACGLPGTSLARSPPSCAAMLLRMASAFSGAPRACSSMTRSSMESGKVTPAALMACRSMGASSQGLLRVAAGLGRVGEDVGQRADALALAGAHDRCRIGRLAQIAHGGRERGDVVDAVGAHGHDAGPPASGSHTRPPARLACRRSAGWRPASCNSRRAPCFLPAPAASVMVG